MDAFRAALHDAIGATTEPEDLEPEIHLDTALDLAAIVSTSGGRFWAVLQQFGPYGPDNPCPLYWGRDLELARPPQLVGRDKKHHRMSVRQRGGMDAFSVIGFGLGDRLAVAQENASRGVPLELAFCVSENRWNGKVSLQLEAKDVRLRNGS